MKKVAIIEFFRIIKNDIKSFLSILLIAGMSVGAFLSLRWLSVSFTDSLLDTLDTYCLHDLEIVCPLGINDESIEEIRKIEDVKYAEGSYVTYSLVNLPDSNSNVKIVSLNENVDLPFDIEGELPSNKGEIAVNKKYATTHNLKIGDTIHLGDAKKLSCSDLKITALVQSVLFCNDGCYRLEISIYNNAPCEGFFYTPSETFDKSSLSGYSEILIKTNYEYTQKKVDKSYSEKIEALKTRLLNYFNSLEPYSSLSENIFLNENQIENLKCKALTRDENKSQSFIDTMPTIMENLGNVLGITMLIGCLIICIFSVSRLIKTNKNLIGTQLSFGIPKRRIILTYCGFLVLAAILGSIIGVLIGRFAILPIILSTIGKAWFFKQTIYYFSFTDTLIVFLIVVLIIFLTGFITCNLFMKKDALELLNESPSSNLNSGVLAKTRLYNKISIKNKMAINNLKADKLRVFGTVSGIVITSALFLNGFAILRLCPSTINKQFDDIYNFNQIVYIDSTNSEAESNVSEALVNEGISYTPVYMSYVGIRTEDGNQNYGSMIVSDNINDAINCFKYETYRNVPIDESIEDFALISSNLTYYDDAKVGNSIFVTNNLGETNEIKIGGFYKHYLPENQILLSRAKYLEFFGEDAKTNAFLIKGNDTAKLHNILNEKDGYVLIENFENYQRYVFNMMSDVTVVLSVVLISISVFLDVFMLLNLFELNLKEKKKDAVTLLMNGYKEKNVKKYIFSDTKFMLIIGLIFGLPLGVALTAITISSIITANSFYSFYVWPLAFLISIVLTLILTFVIMLIKMSSVDKMSLIGNDAQI